MGRLKTQSQSRQRRHALESRQHVCVWVCARASWCHRGECVFVCLCVCVCARVLVSQGQVMTNDGKLEWRLPAARSPCQQRIRGKEAAEKMTVKNTHTNTNRDTQTGRRRGQVLTKASELHRVRWGITGEQFKRDTSLRALITTIPLDWLNGFFLILFFFFFFFVFKALADIVSSKCRVFGQSSTQLIHLQEPGKQAQKSRRVLHSLTATSIHFSAF